MPQYTTKQDFLRYNRYQDTKIPRRRRRRRRPRKRRLKVNLRSFNLYNDYSNSFTLSNASEPFLSKIPKNHIQVQKEKENLGVGCLREIRHFHIVVVQWRQILAVEHLTPK